MAEFCTCGSIIIGGSCSNKNCALRTAVKTTAGRSNGAKSTRSKAAGTAGKEVKSSKTRRASKVVTYNLYDQEEKQENID